MIGTITAAAVSVLALALLIAVRVIENRRDNREEEPTVSMNNKRHLAMTNRLPMNGQRLAWVDFNRGGYTEEEERDGRVVMDAPLEAANVITSLVDIQSITGTMQERDKQSPRISDNVTLHRPVIDIDHPVKIVESSTAGHSHLYVDLVMPWDDLVKLLDVLAEIGLVEPGYVNASKARGYTAVRLPWVSKAELTDQEVQGA